MLLADETAHRAITAACQDLRIRGNWYQPGMLEHVDQALEHDLLLELALSSKAHLRTADETAIR